MILKDKAFMFAKTWLKILRNTWAAKCGNGDLPCLDTLDSIPIPCYYCTLECLASLFQEVMIGGLHYNII